MSTVVRMNPWSACGAVDADFENLVRKAFGTQTAWVPPADIERDGNDAVVTLEIPGVSPEDVNVEVKDRHLTISGERGQRGASDNDDENVSVIRREIRHGEFARSFRLPAHITPEAVSANYRNGLLEVRVSGVRQPDPEPARIPVTTTVEAEVQSVEQGE